MVKLIYGICIKLSFKTKNTQHPSPSSSSLPSVMISPTSPHYLIEDMPAPCTLRAHSLHAPCSKKEGAKTQTKNERKNTHKKREKKKNEEEKKQQNREKTRKK